MSGRGGIALIAAVVGVLGFVAGRMLAPGATGEATPERAATEPEILYWVAPMDPNYRRDAPGKSPMGMDLVPVYADADGAKHGAVSVAPHVQQSLGLTTAVVERSPLWRLIRAPGLVTVDESTITHLHVRTEGWLETLRVESTGETVAPGAVVGQLYSPELVNAQKELLQARDRNQAGVAASARDKLRALGMTRADLEQLERTGRVIEAIDVLAPAGGVITELNVREGMYLVPATVVMSIVDLSRVWVEADVYEAQADWVAEGQPAQLELAYRPGRVFEGQVALVEPVLDPRTRTVRVRLVFDNGDGALRPGMFGSLRIFGGPKRGVLTIPGDALIRGAGPDRVLLALEDNRFAAREVRAGLESGGFVEILEGLEAGDRVVTAAQFLIDSEASMAGALRRLGAEQGERP